jgi:hypothetical protein
MSYRDARGRFISRADYAKLLRRQQQQRARRKARRPDRDRARRRRRAEEESILDDVRKEMRERRLPAGTEFELTATTRGGSPRRKKK